MKAVWEYGNSIKYFEVDFNGSPYDRTIFYVYYTDEGWFDYIDIGGKYYAHDFFTTPFTYTLYDCNAQTNSSSDAYHGEFTDVVYQDNSAGTPYGNDYHWVWLTSCDGINFMWNNRAGVSWRLKAYRDADGLI